MATRAEHLKAANLSESAVLEVIGALAVAMEPVPILWRMRPNSPDPDDDFVIEAAVNAGAQILVTDNRRDLGEACATLGIRTLSPGMLLMELRRSE